MTVLFSGGGTGGHITPILSVAHDVKLLAPSVRLVYVGERHGKFGELVNNSKDIDESFTVFAGKFRRYHGETWLKRLLDMRTILLNIRDVFYIIIGTVQAVWLVRKLRPDVVFLKGGFVGVPVGFAAALWGIPITTHDSDAVGGLANRIVSRWARLHFTAFETGNYPYSADKTMRSGVIVDKVYRKVDAAQQALHKRELGVPADSRLVFVTGGSSGSEHINRAVRAITGELLQKYNDLYIIVQSGKGKAGEFADSLQERLQVHEFLDGLWRYSGAADVIIMRAGANTLAEFGVQAKACIVIPSPHLAGGHQLRNAEQLVRAEAAIVLQEKEVETDPVKLLEATEQLLASQKIRDHLAENIRNVSTTQASEVIAKELCSIGSNEQVKK